MKFLLLWRCLIKVNSHELDENAKLRPWPFPYRSAVAISNDCEFMPWNVMVELYRFLCAQDSLDLEISNSLFFFVTNSLCHSSLSYFQGTSDARSSYVPILREMIHAGYIDTIHAYGDFDAGGFSRSLVDRVLDECARYSLDFRVWTNHGSSSNTQNIGHHRLSNYQQGDNPHHPSYHLALLRQLGVRYFWVDDGFVKAPGDDLPILYTEQARDGSQLILFRRFRGLMGKPAPNAGLLPEQILVSDIDNLIKHEQMCVYYQHLGVWRKTSNGNFEVNRAPFFSSEGLQVLNHLSEAFHAGLCLVATVGRLLHYLEVRDSITVKTADDKIILESNLSDLSAPDFEGITILSKILNPRVVCRQNGKKEIELHHQVFVRDGAEGVCIGIPWKKLEFVW